ncbi:MAG: hypothetical protein FJX80_13145 [Bacteroidetes bacterium]|nr:hypothetical protein [Bacteroidota bacterium]
MIVLIPIETTPRELLYKVYLCNALAQNGLNCYLGSKKSIYFLLNRMTDYVYLDKGYHKGKTEETFNLVKERNGIFVSLDEEGAVDFADNRTLLKRYPRKLFDMVDLVFLWGQAQYNLVKQFISNDSKCVVSGHPRFDLLKPQYQELYRTQALELSRKYGRFILINTNMGFGNNIKGDSFVKLNYNSWFDNIENVISFDKNKIYHIVNLIKYLDVNLNTKIILRPHPEERLETYELMLKGCRNVEVLYEGSVVPWIIACDLLIHPDCTTAIECQMLGKRPISYLPQRYDENLVTNVPVAISKIQSKQEIVDFYKNSLLRDPIAEKNDEIIEEYFSYSQSSSTIIAESILSIVRNKKTQFGKSKLPFKYVLTLKYMSAKAKVAGILFNNNLSKNKLKGLTLTEIKKLLKLMNSKDKTDIVSVKQTGSGLFYFSRTS